MVIRRIYLFFAFGASIVVVAQRVVSDADPEQQHIPIHQIITFRPAPHYQLNTIPLEQIVLTMRQKKPLPKHSGTIIHERAYHAYKGIRIKKTDHTVFIFVRGFEPRPCAAYAARLYEQHSISPSCTLIGFDFDDQGTRFSFGQDNDVAFLSMIYEAILHQNSAAQIILIGNCNGAKIAMEFATRKPRNLKALILLTPFISARSLFQRMTEYYAFGLPFSAKLAQLLFRTCTTYDPQKDDLIDRITQIDRRLPIFIGQRMFDAIVPDNEVEHLADFFKERGNPLDGLIVYDPSRAHNNLITNKTIQYRINHFLKKHHLPYNQTALLRPAARNVHV